MPQSSVLVNSLRDSLYDADELYDRYDSTDFRSYKQTFDFRVYQDFVSSGKIERASGRQAIVQSLHDGSIMQATKTFTVGQKIVAFMGGHKLSRASELYREVVLMAKHLTERKYLVVTGGGPGAMEAAHLGALLADLKEGQVDKAIERLAVEPSLPQKLEHLVDDKGKVNEDLLQQVHRWLRPALGIAREYERRSHSLGIPTWHYGQEPSTPFASHIAKYFQNSIREDGMLALANYGIIYVEGRAGTLQEIFQDAAQNYYKTFGFASPMVFYKKKQWLEDLPIKPLLDKLFDGEGNAPQRELLTYADTPGEVYEAVERFSPPQTKQGQA
ncbi:LOG family protein [Candidatus Nitrospira nitrificans]|nr:hypothetical protein [Candidatus Nitrospira nitrificans]